MERINTSTKAADLFGPGKHGFQASGPGGVQPTQLSAEWCNNIQEELANAIEGAGLTVGGGMSQLLAAINALADAKAALRANPTGQVAHYFGTSAPAGWLVRDGSTIGNAASGATARANADTEALFTLIWNGTTNAGDFVIQDNTGADTTRGASAAADFAAGKRVRLPDDRGRFDRGLNTSGSGIDASRTLASLQAQAGGLSSVSSVASDPGDPPQTISVPQDGTASSAVTSGDAQSASDQGLTFTNAADLRPANRAYLPIIKL